MVATSEPTNVIAIEDVKRQTQMNLELVVCPDEDIDAVCSQFTEKEADAGLVDDIFNDMTDVEIIQDEQRDIAEDLEKMAGQSPVIKFVNYLISNAIREGASDIHIEPKDTYSKIRYRIDGVLFETTQAPLKMHPAVVSRIKIMANLDISERRLPQDGKISASMSAAEESTFVFRHFPQVTAKKSLYEFSTANQLREVWTSWEWSRTYVKLLREQIDTASRNSAGNRADGFR